MAAERKKKLADAADACEGSIVAYAQLVGRRPSYLEYAGFRFNERRQFYRRAGAVAYGAGIALGSIQAGESYFRAVTDGEGEALLFKAQYDALRQNRASRNGQS